MEGGDSHRCIWSSGKGSEFLVTSTATATRNGSRSELRAFHGVYRQIRCQCLLKKPSSTAAMTTKYDGESRSGTICETSDNLAAGGAPAYSSPDVYPARVRSERCGSIPSHCWLHALGLARRASSLSRRGFARAWGRQRGVTRTASRYCHPPSF
jgi:hypothetical protein